jgi:hypothetical protein
MVFTLGNRMDADWAGADGGYAIQDSVVPAVRQEAEIAQQVHPDDQELDVGHYKAR